MSLPAFCSAVLEGYRALPDTPNRSSRSDRSLAENWFHQQIPWPHIQAAFALALLRRHLRPEGSPPLPPIRSLHYFVPLLEEVSQQAPRYVDYCRFRAHRLFPNISFLQL